MHPELKAGVWVTPVEVEPDYVKSSANPHCCQCHFHAEKDGAEACGLPLNEACECLFNNRQVYKLLSIKD